MDEGRLGGGQGTAPLAELAVETARIQEGDPRGGGGPRRATASPTPRSSSSAASGPTWKACSEEEPP